MDKIVRELKNLNEALKLIVEILEEISSKL
jgi:hypothetical protein